MTPLLSIPGVLAGNSSRFYVATEAGRHTTTILLVSEAKLERNSTAWNAIPATSSTIDDA